MSLLDGVLRRHPRPPMPAPVPEPTMDRSDLIDVMRRAVKLAVDNDTDMTTAEAYVPVAHYSDPERFAAERALVGAAPQLVGYASELPRPGTFTTKDVLGTPVLLTRAKDGVVRAFRNICLHRQARVAKGCGEATKLTCGYHSWVYNLEGVNTGAPGARAFSDARKDGLRLTELPAAEYAGFLWVGLDPTVPLDLDAHLGPLGRELASWRIGEWTPVGEKQLDVPIDWKLALDTFAENYHFATVHADTFAQVARSNCTVFDSFGRHHRLVFPMLGIEEAATVPEDEWDPLSKVVVIYALYPNVVLSVTAVNGEIFRVYPGTGPGHSVTYHQNAARVDAGDEAGLAGAREIFEYAHGTVRDEDYALAETIQQNMATGLEPRLILGRNEPGVQHRHAVLAAELARAAAAS